MSIPTEKTDIEQFTPESLKNLATPPVFLLRPATGREDREYRRVMAEEGFVYNAPDDLRGEALRVLAQLWSPDVYEREASRLRSAWAMMDQGIELDQAERDAVDELHARLAAASPRLRRMAHQNGEFSLRALDISLSLMLCGWKRFDCSYRKEDGRTPFDVLDAVAAKLEEIEKTAVADKVEGVVVGLSYLQLRVAAQNRMHLTKDEEKNSVSLPPTPLAPSGSTTTPSAKTAGRSSRASASSGSTSKGRSAGSRKAAKSA